MILIDAYTTIKKAPLAPAALQRLILQILQTASDLRDLSLILDLTFMEHSPPGIGVAELSAGLINNIDLESFSAVAVSGLIPDQLEIFTGQFAQDKHKLWAYSVKYASAFYGPIRQNFGGTTASRLGNTLNPKTYESALQMAKQAEALGLHTLGFKPSLYYLDILSQIRRQSPLNLVVHQSSGEFRLLSSDIERQRQAIRKTFAAGASDIISYSAINLARLE